MPGLRKARAIKVIAASAGITGVVVVIGYVRHAKSVTTIQSPLTVAQTSEQSKHRTDGNTPLHGDMLPLGSLFGCNNPARPPVVFSVGRSPDEADRPDLSSPPAAVYSVLSLIDQAATDKLGPCLLEETEETLSDLYPRCLGHPVELVEVLEEGESARVVWDATVKTAFSRHGKQWSPGETVTLSARLVQVEGLWKLLQLHDGDEDGDRQLDIPAD